MPQYDVKKMLVTTMCQKCPAKPAKVPLIDFLLPNGLLWVPEILYCPECGHYVTIQTREMTKDELKERDGKQKVDPFVANIADEIEDVATEILETGLQKDNVKTPKED